MSAAALSQMYRYHESTDGSSGVCLSLSQLKQMDMHETALPATYIKGGKPVQKGLPEANTSRIRVAGNAKHNLLAMLNTRSIHMRLNSVIQALFC